MLKLRGKGNEQTGWIGLAITIGIITVLALTIDLGQLKDVIAEAGPYGPLVFILAKVSTVIVAPLSGAPLYPLAGLFFGFWPGLLFVVIGDFIGYTTAFFISRFFGYHIVRKFIDGKERSLFARIIDRAGTVKGFFHVCITCFAVPELISYGAGLTKLPYPIFIGILLPLISAGTVVLVLFGSLLEPGNHSLFIALGLPLAGLVIMSLGGYLFLRGLKEEN